MKKFNYYLSKNPQRGFKVGDKVALFIQVNNEYLTGAIRYFEIFSEGIYAVFGNYRASLGSLQRYRPFMDGGALVTANATQLSINF